MKLLTSMMMILLAMTAGCETKRVEYRTRPAWERMLGGEAPESSVRADGTEVRWIDDHSRELSGFEQTIGGEQVQLRTEDADGGVAVRSVLPMHLVVNLLECLRRSEYRVIYDQMISSSQREWYAAQGDGGYDRFLDWFQRRRKDVASTLNRMKAGKVFGEVVIAVEGETASVSLRPNVAYDFHIKGLDLVREQGDWKLQDIW